MVKPGLEDLTLPTLAARMFADVDGGDMMQYHTRQLEIVANFAIGTRQYYQKHGKEAVVEYLTDKIAKVCLVLRTRPDGEMPVNFH